jgi:hypothetical protein
MRFVLALGIFIAFWDSASAAARVYHAKPRHVLVRGSQAAIPGYAVPGSAGIERDDSVPGGFRATHDDPPSYDDPSKFGGG